LLRIDAKSLLKRRDLLSRLRIQVESEAEFVIRSSLTLVYRGTEKGWPESQGGNEHSGHSHDARKKSQQDAVTGA
jgi:hypothetical protein